VKEISDADLLLESIGNPERFELIFERPYHVVRRYAQRRAGLEAGEDLAAQTFVTAFTGRAAFDGRSDSARPWLFGIANNLVRHHLRSERARWAAWTRVPAEVLEAGEMDPDRLDAMRAAPAIERAIGSLRESDREAFLLYALGQLSYGEVADAMDVPIGTVRSRIFRVRRILRELLDEQRATTGEVPGSGNASDRSDRSTAEETDS